MINITLVPRLLPKTSNLETHLRLDRIDIASKWLGMDFKKVFIDSLSSGMQEVYDQYRWVIIPHILAADCPVIYALPPMDQSDNWPWEGLVYRWDYSYYSSSCSLYRKKDQYNREMV